jgi:hypothetical protein
MSMSRIERYSFIGGLSLVHVSTCFPKSPSHRCSQIHAYQVLWTLNMVFRSAQTRTTLTPCIRIHHAQFHPFVIQTVGGSEQRSDPQLKQLPAQASLKSSRSLFLSLLGPSRAIILSTTCCIFCCLPQLLLAVLSPLVRSKVHVPTALKKVPTSSSTLRCLMRMKSECGMLSRKSLL